MISASGFATTIAWYNWTAKKDLFDEDAQPIARMVNSINQVQRRPARKLLWHPVSDNETLFVGEAIRTSVNSEAIIQFLNSDTRIELEPDSAIILEESAGEIALNFLQGNLFVRSSGEAGEAQVRVRTGDRDIALNNSDLNLSRDSASGELDLQVLRGTAQVKSESGETLTLDINQSLTGRMIQVLSPEADATLYVDPQRRERVSFNWEPLPESFTVTLEAGPTRNSMRPVPGAVASGDQGELHAVLNPGRINYRLVARRELVQEPGAEADSTQELRSATLRAQVVAKTPPVLLEPEREQNITRPVNEPQVRFVWTNPAQFTKTVFEISPREDFEGAFQRPLEGQSDLRLEVRNNGTYYWRVAGILPGTNELVYSNASQFNMRLRDEVPSPNLLSPNDKERRPYDRFLDSGLLLTWSTVRDASSYQVVVSKLSPPPRDAEDRTPASTEVVKEVTELPEYRIRDLEPGRYTWTVSSINKDGRASMPEETRTFDLVALPVIPWAEGNPLEKDHYYITLRPTVDLFWETGVPGVSRWRVRIDELDSGLSELSPNFLVSQPRARAPLDHEGTYLAEVEGLNAQNEVIARSQSQTVRVVSAPLLPAPRFASDLPLEIEANNAGNARISWDPVDGAEKYVLSIISPDENEREIQFESQVAPLRGLMPGEYRVRLKSVDEHGRKGPESEERVLRVPATSDAPAPSLRGFKVQ